MRHAHGAFMDPAQTQTPSRLLAVGLLFLAFAGIAWSGLGDSKAAFTNFVMPGDPGPFFLADFSIAVIALAGAGLTVRSLLLRRRAGPGSRAGYGGDTPLSRWVLPAVFVITLVGLPTAMTALGTPAAIAVFAFGWIAALQLRSKKSLVPGLAAALLGAAAASAFVQLVFIRLLAAPLPL